MMNQEVINIYIDVLNRTIDGLVKEKILLQTQKEYSEQSLKTLSEENEKLKIKVSKEKKPAN